MSKVNTRLCYVAGVLLVSSILATACTGTVKVQTQGTTASTSPISVPTETTDTTVIVETPPVSATPPPETATTVTETPPTATETPTPTTTPPTTSPTTTPPTTSPTTTPPTTSPTTTPTPTPGPFTITASAGSNGSIAPAGPVTVNSGASQTFTITPAAGYRISTLTVDGIGAIPASSYNFSNVTASHTINATFALLSTPTTTTPPSVTVTIDANSTVPAGSTLVVNVNVSAVTDLDGWQFYLSYDKNVLQVIGAEGASGVTPGLIGSATAPVGVWGFYPAGTPGKIVVAGWVQTITITGSGTPPSYLAQIHFQVVGAPGASCNITPSQVLLYDHLLNGMPVTVVGRSVQVTASH